MNEAKKWERISIVLFNRNGYLNDFNRFLIVRIVWSSQSSPKHTVNWFFFVRNEFQIILSSQSFSPVIFNWNSKICFVRWKEDWKEGRMDDALSFFFFSSSNPKFRSHAKKISRAQPQHWKIGFFLFQQNLNYSVTNSSDGKKSKFKLAFSRIHMFFLLRVLEK